jgi:hypothetical protein
LASEKEKPSPVGDAVKPELLGIEISMAAFLVTPNQLQAVPTLASPETYMDAVESVPVNAVVVSGLYVPDAVRDRFELTPDSTQAQVGCLPTDTEGTVLAAIAVFS